MKMNKEKIIMLLIESLIREFGVATLDELIILCMRKGIKISTQFISNVYYNFQWNNRKQIPYTPIKNDLTQIKTKVDLKKDKTKYYC